MYLLNEDNKIALYDIDFIDRKGVKKIAKELALNSIKMDEFIVTKGSSECEKLLENDNKQPICDPVYVGKDTKDGTMKVVEYSSKTPYTLALVGYYAKNNFIQTLYSSMEFSNGKDIYLQKLVKRMISGCLVFPQLYMTKCNFDYESYKKHDRLFENLKKDAFSLEFFISEYYPDLKSFIDLLPCMEFTLEEVFNRNHFQEDSWQAVSARCNTETLKQLGLTPNIRN